jgi:hypothetical protein
MNIAPTHRELELQSALQQELTRVDPTVLPALARALERSNDRLVGGSWGVDDGDSRQRSPRASLASAAAKNS